MGERTWYEANILEDVLLCWQNNRASEASQRFFLNESQLIKQSGAIAPTDKVAWHQKPGSVGIFLKREQHTRQLLGAACLLRLCRRL